MASLIEPSAPNGPPQVSGWQPVDLGGRGVTRAYQHRRRHRSRTIVLLHGWNATGALNWARTIERLGEHYHVVALDHRGHGQGIKDGTAFTLEDCADDAVALLDSLGITSAIFLGYSMGGPIAQLVWRQHPHRVDGLVFYATAADFTGISNLGPLVRAYGALRRRHGSCPASCGRVSSDP